MTPEYYHEYLRADNRDMKHALEVMNPTKCAAMDYLLDYHSKNGDKIIVFSESVNALRMYARLYKYVRHGCHAHARV